MSNTARSPRITRFVLITVCGTVILIELLALHACWRSVHPAAEMPARIDDSVVALVDGSVVIAKPGTLTRDVVDWFNAKDAAPARFDLGKIPFVQGSAQPAPDQLVRLNRFASELKASRTVKTKILVCTSTNTTADAGLAALRAQRISDELIANRIEPNRVSAETCRAKPTRGVASVSEQDEQTVIIELERG